MKKIIACAVLALSLGSSALARDSALPVPLPIDPLNLNSGKGVTPDQLADKIREWVTSDGSADLTAALAVAKAANNTVTTPCWTAIQGFVTQVQALPAADQLPKVHLAVDVEIATDLMLALQPNSPIITGCAALANAQKLAAGNLVTGIVTGALSVAKLAPIVP